MRYWIARNSWGEAWGQMGFMLLERGKNAAGVENECVWAVPKSYTDKIKIMEAKCKEVEGRADMSEKAVDKLQEEVEKLEGG